VLVEVIHDAGRTVVIAGRDPTDQASSAQWWKLATLPDHLLRSAMFRVLLALTIISLAPDLLQFLVQHVKHNMRVRCHCDAILRSSEGLWAVQP